MNKIVSVDEALKKGQQIVNYPVLGIILSWVILSIYLISENYISDWEIPLGYVISFGFAWLYWSIMITYWRLWAFENVRNVHELKKRAIQEKLIWEDNSMFAKTEIRTARQQEKWKILQDKFQNKDAFYDNQDIPYETIIYYSKVKNYFEMLMMFGLTSFGIYLLLKTDNYIWGTLLCCMGIYFAYKEFKEATNTTPQIIINDKGIQTISTDFFSWKDIHDDEVISNGYGDSIEYNFIYQHPNGSEHLKINDYNTDQKSLNQLLRVYRGRYNQKAI